MTTTRRNEINDTYAAVRAVLVEPLNYADGEIKERAEQMINVARSLNKADTAQIADEYGLRLEILQSQIRHDCGKKMKICEIIEKSIDALEQTALKKPLADKYFTKSNWAEKDGPGEV